MNSVNTSFFTLMFLNTIFLRILGYFVQMYEWCKTELTKTGNVSFIPRFDIFSCLSHHN